MTHQEKVATLGQLKVWLINEGFKVSLYGGSTPYIQPHLQIRGGYFIPAIHVFVQNEVEVIFSRKQDLSTNKDGWVYYMNIAEPTSDLLGLLRTLFETDTKLVKSLKKKDVYDKKLRELVETDKAKRERKKTQKLIRKWAATKGVK
jgi:hypothetical protein